MTGNEIQTGMIQGAQDGGEELSKTPLSSPKNCLAAAAAVSEDAQTLRSSSFAWIPNNKSSKMHDKGF